MTFRLSLPPEVALICITPTTKKNEFFVSDWEWILILTTEEIGQLMGGN